MLRPGAGITNGRIQGMRRIIRWLSSHIGFFGHSLSGFLLLTRNRNNSRAAVRGAYSSNEPGVPETVLPFYSADAGSAYATMDVMMYYSSNVMVHSKQRVD